MPSLVIPKQSWRNAALACSMELISSFGSDDFSGLNSLVAEDVLYMTPRTSVPSRGNKQFVCEMKELSNLFGSDVVPSRIMLDVIDLSPESWLVAARYSLVHDSQEADEVSTSVLQSFVWTADIDQTDAHVKLVACHTSLPEEQSTSSGISAESIRSFASELLRASGARTNGELTTSPKEGKVSLQARDSKGLTHWVQPSSVIYVEASHQYTNVYCRDRSIRLRTPFSTVLEQLGNVVIKVHRSYAVNPAYVSTLENEMLYLTTGDKVPVPAKRVKTVRAALADRFEQLGMRE